MYHWYTFIESMRVGLQYFHFLVQNITYILKHMKKMIFRIKRRGCYTISHLGFKKKVFSVNLMQYDNYIVFFTLFGRISPFLIILSLLQYFFVTVMFDRVA